MTATAKVIPERLAQIAALSLKRGSHSPDSDFCVMEAVAYVAGEPWSDAPKCACPVIRRFMLSWNDSLASDADRDRLLKPLIPSLLGTRNLNLGRKRHALVMDWFIRVNVPAWLRVAGLTEQASALEELAPITSVNRLAQLHAPLKSASSAAAATLSATLSATRDATHDAAQDDALSAALDAALVAAMDAAQAATRAGALHAAWILALDATLSATGDATRAATRSATRAATLDGAWDAALDAALAAALAAALDATLDAAQVKLLPVTEQLQQSAVQLVARMIGVS